MKKFTEMTLREIKQFAAEAHAKVGKKYGEHPYSYHYERCDEVRRRFKFYSRDYAIAVNLHDVVEDTEETIGSLLLRGISLLTLKGIWGVTDEEAPTRAERKRLTYPKTGLWRIGVVVKLIDRIANVEENIRTGNLKMFEKYKGEYAGLKASLRDPSDKKAEAMWTWLDYLFAEGRELMERFARGECVQGIPA
jgi:hypothetical protein